MYFFRKTQHISWLFWWIYCVCFNPWHAELIKMPCPLLIFSQSNYLIQIVDIKFTYLMANSADPDQLASSEANWSGSTLFAKAGYIWVQQTIFWDSLHEMPKSAFWKKKYIYHQFVIQRVVKVNMYRGPVFHLSVCSVSQPTLILAPTLSLIFRLHFTIFIKRNG